MPCSHTSLLSFLVFASFLSSPIILAITHLLTGRSLSLQRLRDYYHPGVHLVYPRCSESADVCRIWAQVHFTFDCKLL
ncbi:hypothetical protein BDR07DRAFT_1395263 [Suillus spraguei]|nr:hypothetical protein BDR07DRAFT_1395263 [Suillus spraguei]